MSSFATHRYAEYAVTIIPLTLLRMCSKTCFGKDPSFAGPPPCRFRLRYSHKLCYECAPKPFFVKRPSLCQLCHPFALYYTSNTNSVYECVPSLFFETDPLLCWPSSPTFVLYYNSNTHSFTSVLPNLFL